MDNRAELLKQSLKKEATYESIPVEALDKLQIDIVYVLDFRQKKYNIEHEEPFDVHIAEIFKTPEKFIAYLDNNKDYGGKNTDNWWWGVSTQVLDIQENISGLSTGLIGMLGFFNAEGKFMGLNQI